MLVLNQADVEAVLPMAACIEAMQALFIGMAGGEYFNPLRQRARPEGHPNWITMMPALRLAEPRLWALKEMAVNPANTAAGLDPIQGAVLAGSMPGRRDNAEFTLYKALGFAALDLAAAELAVREARRAGRGVEVAW